jgi:hypothetical protein
VVYIDVENGGSGVDFPETLSKGIAAITGVDRVVPGHGSVMTWDDLKMHRRIFSSRANPPSRVARSRLLDYTRRTIMKPE